MEREIVKLIGLCFLGIVVAPFSMLFLIFFLLDVAIPALLLLGVVSTLIGLFLGITALLIHIDNTLHSG